MKNLAKKTTLSVAALSMIMSNVPTVKADVVVTEEDLQNTMESAQEAAKKVLENVDLSDKEHLVENVKNAAKEYIGDNIDQTTVTSVYDKLVELVPEISDALAQEDANVLEQLKDIIENVEDVTSKIETPSNIIKEEKKNLEEKIEELAGKTDDVIANVESNIKNSYDEITEGIDGIINNGNAIVGDSIENLETTLGEINQELDSKVEKAEEAAKDVTDEFNSVLDGIENVGDDVAEKVESVTGEINKNQSDINDLIKETLEKIESNMSAMEGMESSVEYVEVDGNKYTEAEWAAMQAKAEEEAIKAEIAEVTKDLSNSLTYNEDLVKELEALQERAEAAANAAKKAEAAAEAEAMAAKQDIEKLETTIGSTKAMLDNLLVAIEEAKNISGDLDGLMDRYTEAVNQLNAYQEQLSEATIKLEAAKVAAGVAKEAVDAADKVLDATEEKMEAVNGEINEILTAAIKKAEAEAKEAQDNADIAKEQAVKAREEAEKAYEAWKTAGDNAILEAEYLAKDAVAKAAAELAERAAEEAMKAQQAVVDAKNAEYEKEKSAYESITKEIEDLTTEKNGLETDLNELKGLQDEVTRLEGEVETATTNAEQYAQGKIDEAKDVKNELNKISDIETQLKGFNIENYKNGTETVKTEDLELEAPTQPTLTEPVKPETVGIEPTEPKWWNYIGGKYNSKYKEDYKAYENAYSEYLEANEGLEEAIKEYNNKKEAYDNAWKEYEAASWLYKVALSAALDTINGLHDLGEISLRVIENGEEKDITITEEITAETLEQYHIVGYAVKKNVYNYEQAYKDYENCTVNVNYTHGTDDEKVEISREYNFNPISVDKDGNYYYNLLNSTSESLKTISGMKESVNSDLNSLDTIIGNYSSEDYVKGEIQGKQNELETAKNNLNSFSSEYFESAEAGNNRLNEIKGSLETLNSEKEEKEALINQPTAGDYKDAIVNNMDKIADLFGSWEDVQSFLEDPSSFDTSKIDWLPQAGSLVQEIAVQEAILLGITGVHAGTVEANKAATAELEKQLEIAKQAAQDLLNSTDELGKEAALTAYLEAMAALENAKELIGNDLAEDLKQIQANHKEQSEALSETLGKVQDNVQDLADKADDILAGLESAEATYEEKAQKIEATNTKLEGIKSDYDAAVEAYNKLQQTVLVSPDYESELAAQKAELEALKSTLETVEEAKNDAALAAAGADTSASTIKNLLCEDGVGFACKLNVSLTGSDKDATQVVVNTSAAEGMTEITDVETLVAHVANQFDTKDAKEKLGALPLGQVWEIKWEVAKKGEDGQWTVSYSFEAVADENYNPDNGVLPMPGVDYEEPGTPVVTPSRPSTGGGSGGGSSRPSTPTVEEEVEEGEEILDIEDEEIAQGGAVITNPVIAAVKDVQLQTYLNALVQKEEIKQYSTFGLKTFDNSRVTGIKATSKGFTITGYMWIDGVSPTKDTWREIVLVNTEDMSTEFAYRKQTKAVDSSWLNDNKIATQDGKLDLTYAGYSLDVNYDDLNSYTDNKSGAKIKAGTYQMFMRISDGKDSFLFPLVDRVLSDGSTMESTGTLPAEFNVMADEVRSLTVTIK